MPLTAAKFKFLRAMGIKRKVASAHEADFEAASGAGPDEIYRETESAVIDAVARLVAASASPAVIARCEADVTQVQQLVTGDDGTATAEVLQDATAQLVKIKVGVEESVRAAEALLKEGYDGQLAKIQKRRATLQVPGVNEDLTRWIDGQIRAAAMNNALGKYALACDTLDTAEAELDRAEQSLRDYEAALRSAEDALKTAIGRVPGLDVEDVRHIIHLAKHAAGNHDRRGALDLLSTAEQRCRPPGPIDPLNTAFPGPDGLVRLHDMEAPLLELKKHPGRAEFAREIGALTERFANVRRAVARGMSLVLRDRDGGMARTAPSEEALLIFDEANKQLGLANEHASSGVQYRAAKRLFKQLEESEPRNSNEAIRSELVACQATLKLAKQHAASRFHDRARAALKEVTETCAAARQIKQAHANFADELERTQRGLSRIEPAGGPLLQADIDALHELLAQSQVLAQAPARDYAGACRLLGRIERDRTALEQCRQATAADLRNLRGMTDLMGSDLQTALTQWRRLLKALEARPGGWGIQVLLKQIGATIDAAEKSVGKDPGKCRALLHDAAGDYELAVQLAVRFALHAERRDGQILPACRELASDDSIAQAELEPLADTVDEAERQALGSFFPAASALFDQALGQIAAIRARKARAELLRTSLEELRRRAGGWGLDRMAVPIDKVDEALKAPLIDLDAVDQRLTTATGVFKQLELERALLRRADQDKLVAHMQALRDHGPKGDELLDEFVSSLSSPLEILLLMRVRFKLTSGAADRDYENPRKRATRTELLRLYQAMAAVPDSHAKNNPSLREVERAHGETSHAYYPLAKSILINSTPESINMHRALVPAAWGGPDLVLDDPSGLPEIHLACRLDPSAPAPSRFNWSVHHEIGHAVDDRLGFMNARMGNANFGGWIDHGGNVLIVTQAVAEELGIPRVDAIVIAKFLEDGKKPAGLTDPRWSLVDDWARGVRAPHRPWNHGTRCTTPIDKKGFSVKGRVYHEAYANRWVSYLAEARKQGVLVYQFRAPGEWFSELYAAHLAKVLKREHPANHWLSKLFDGEQ